MLGPTQAFFYDRGQALSYAQSMLIGYSRPGIKAMLYERTEVVAGEYELRGGELAALAPESNNTK
jgi:hypothetical protein